jgi:hypothetical protein
MAWHNVKVTKNGESGLPPGLGDLGVLSMSIFPDMPDNDVDRGCIAIEGTSAGVTIAQEVITGDEPEKAVPREIPVIPEADVEIETADLGGGPVGFLVTGGDVDEVDAYAGREAELITGLMDKIAGIIEAGVAALIEGPGHQTVVAKNDIGIWSIGKTKGGIEVPLVMSVSDSEAVVDGGMNTQQSKMAGGRPDAGTKCQYAP